MDAVAEAVRADIMQLGPAGASGGVVEEAEAAMAAAASCRAIADLSCW